MTEHWPKSVETVTRRYYCDTCKEGTPHIETSPDTWRCSIPHKSSKEGRKQNAEMLDFRDTTEAHIAALDGMGNRDPFDRGQQPPRKEKEK
jgi:hypothetical protein